MRWTVGGKRDRVEMIFGRRVDLGPFLAAVFRNHHGATRADNYGALRILHVNSVETRDQSRTLALPLKAAVRCVKNHSV